MKKLYPVLIGLLCCTSGSAQMVTTMGGKASAGSSSYHCVQDPVTAKENVNSASLTDFARVSLPKSADCSFWLQSTLDQPCHPGSFAGFHVRSAATAEIQGIIKIETYLNGSLQESSTGSALSVAGKVEQDVFFQAQKTYDAIRIVCSGTSATTGSMDVFYGFGTPDQPNGKPLPVYIPQFRAVRQMDRVVLNWEIITEEGMESIEVEQSAGPEEEFVRIGQTTPQTPHRYSFTGKASSGHFRVKVKTASGVFYSKAIFVAGYEEVKMTCTNPIRGQLKITLSNAQDFFSVRLVSSTGNVVEQKQGKIEGETVVALGTRQPIPPGNYMLMINCGNGWSKTGNVVFR